MNEILQLKIDISDCTVSSVSIEDIINPKDLMNWIIGFPLDVANEFLLSQGWKAVHVDAIDVLVFLRRPVNAFIN